MDIKPKNFSQSIPDHYDIEIKQYIESLEKELFHLDFKLNRTLKDKSIAVNLLKESIKDLQNQQLIIKQTNLELSQRKEEIEAQNFELSAQKQLVEDQAKTLTESLQKLEISYVDLEQFSYIISHDLQSPLRTITNYVKLLNRHLEGKIDSNAVEFLQFIMKGTLSMDEVIQDLLKYSRVNKEKNFNKTNLNNTLEMVKYNLQQEILENQATIQYNNLPELYVIKSGILQLFQNLIGNSIKYRAGVPPIITIDYQKKEECFYFQVSDNGLGMDEGYQEKAFIPFQRINHLDRPGTGMGLAICKKIVKLHKGDIWYQSTHGKGTTFHFTIPAGAPTN